MDLLVVRTDVLARPDGVKFAKAITGAWYETVGQLAGGQAAAIKGSADASCDSVASYKDQLKTTYLFSSAKSAADFADSPNIKQKMELVRQFCFRHQLLGQNISSVNDVAIRYPDGSVQGKQDRVRFRFDSSYMKMAEQGKL